MKKKMVLITCLSISALTISTALVLSNSNAFGVKGEHIHSGYHYDEVFATSSSFGHIEHWTCCECREFFTTKPEGNFIDLGSGSAHAGSFSSSVIYHYISFDKQGGTGGTDSFNNILLNDELPSITVPTKEGYTFDGYYESPNGVGKKYYSSTGVALCNFTISTLETTYYANWVDSWDKAHGVVPVINGNKLTYGLYPQTIVTSPSQALIEAGNDKEDEEYFSYDNEYYVKDTAHPYLPTYAFSDDTLIEEGTTYYFRCEPIEWNICASSDTYTIDSTKVIYNHIFNECPSAKTTNLYASSELRTWLNGDFYNKAFSLKTTSSYIEQTVLTDVSAMDNVWAGSKTQYEDTWEIDPDKEATDFALCNGVRIYDNYDRHGYYWTRTPKDSSQYNVWFVNPAGATAFDRSDTAYVGIVPAVTIKL